MRHLSSESSNRLEIIEVEDITDNAISGAVKHVEATLGDRGLDVLINVVGSNQPVTSDGLRTLKSTDLLTAFNTNVLTTHVMISHMLPLLKKGEAKKIINISTSLGSIAYARQTSFAPVHAYKISKAALNMLTAQYAVDLEKDGFCVLAVSPGVSIGNWPTWNQHIFCSSNILLCGGFMPITYSECKSVDGACFID